MIWLLLLAVGATITAVTFWDKLRNWWLEFIDPILEAFGLESIRKAFIQFDRVAVRTRRIIKRAVAFFQVSKEKAVKRTTEEEIDITDIPTDIQEPLLSGNKVLCVLRT